ncbi:MAG: DUF5723 family protein [Bacteroidales bacterium]
MIWRVFLYISFAFVAVSISAQTLNSLYFLDEWSLRHRSNAAFAPEFGYVSIPFLGSSQFSLSSNIGLSDVVFPYEDGFVTFMHPSVDENSFLSGIHKDNYFSQESNNNFISVGFWGSNSGFWTFSMSLKEQLIMNAPYDLFHLAKVGMKGVANHYDLTNLYMKNTYYGELSIGYSQDVDEQFRLGGKVKLIAGLVSTNINYSQFDVDLSQQEWRSDAKGEMMLNSRVFRFNKDADGYLKFDDYNFNINSFKPSGNGIALDFGTTYKANDALTLGLSFSDLGFITWRRNSWQRGVVNGSFSFKGFQNVDLANVNLTSQVETLKNDAMTLVKFKEEEGNDEYKLQELPATWNLSAEYSFLQNHDRDVTAGLLWNSRYIENRLFTELLGALTLKPYYWLTSSLTYSIASNKPNTLGFAINFSPKWINLFIASDGINTRLSKQYLPINPFYTSIQAGITIPLSKNVKYKEKNQSDYYHRR